MAREEQLQELLDWINQYPIPSSLYGTGQGKMLTISMYRLLIIMALSNVNDAALLEIDDPFTKELVEIWSCLNFKKTAL